ncbi:MULTISPECIES: hypothetical protein [Nostocales]|jgi:hypothetical protein|uniref:Uncharacterized protein n=1 Tax=Dolichospermum flos-aquae UHCC 0037 TaxID=2590026 RepID=A0ACC7S8Q0_DOLFA|nr:MULTISPECIES: hypothetical protein [Nostocales]MBO1065133.1 hypothetical protein [Anabaena sp. 54]MTJ44885.1 hypothetical protein [Dolichospermum flos-aquae UHCC 0037]
MVHLRTTNDFLTIVDLHIRIKITKSEEAASQFTSQNDVSIALKESYTLYIIPCLIGIRKSIEEVIKESNGNNYNAKEAFSSLIFIINKEINQIEILKQKCVDPIMLAGLNLRQGICADVIEEIEPMLYQTRISDNKNQEQPVQELDPKPLSNPINETNETSVSTYDSSAVANQYRQDIVRNNVPVSNSNKQEIPQSQNISQLSTRIIPVLEIIILSIIGILLKTDKNPIISGLGQGILIAPVMISINLLNNTKPDAKDITELNTSTNFSVTERPELLNILILQSPIRYIFLCIITGGLYIYYWFYKNWVFIKKLQNLNIIPVLCGAFPGITIYSLTKRIFAIAKEKGYLINSKPVGIFFMQSFMTLAIGRTPGITGLIPLLFTFYPTIYIYDSLTYYAKKTHPNYQELGFFSGGMIGWIIFGIIFWTWMVS